MSKERDLEFVNARDLKLNRYISLAGSDYQITNLILNGEGKVVVVALPVGAKKLNFRKQRKLELRLIVPQNTPFIVLK